jgi:hypothetical protein
MLARRHSAAGATPPVLFALDILEMGSLPGLQFSNFTLSAVAGMIGRCHYAQLFSVELGSCKLFCLGWHRTRILTISSSASRVSWVQ